MSQLRVETYYIQYSKYIIYLKIKRPDLHHDRMVEVSLDFGNSYSGTLTQATDSSDLVLHHAAEYFSFYEHDALIPKNVEQSFSVVLYENEEEDFRVVIYQGVVDLIAEYIQNGKSYEVGIDHKSTRRNSDPSLFLLFLISFGVILSLLILMNSLLIKLDFKKPSNQKIDF